MATANFEILKEGGEDIIKIDYNEIPYSPSIEDSALVMSDAIDKLLENPSVKRLVFVQKRNYSYNAEQTALLRGIADIFISITKTKRLLSQFRLPEHAQTQQRLAELRDMVYTLLKSDPLSFYVELKRMHRIENLAYEKAGSSQTASKAYLDILEELISMLEGAQLIRLARAYLAGHTLSDRSIYKLFFNASITPEFVYTKIITSPPKQGEQLDVYNAGNAEINLFNVPDDIKKLYHVLPPESRLSEDKYHLIELARKIIEEHKPKEEEFLDPEKMRATFTNISKDLLLELAEQDNIGIDEGELNELSEIVVRNTIGFGILEVILKDQKIQDITLNAPMGQSPLFVLHQDYGECYTNLVPSISDFESWASKFRLLSGRPLDEANPILDTELILPDARTRVALVHKPLNPFGIAMAFRRHADKPWTLPKYISNRMLNPLAAGIISFLIDGGRTLLIAGTRSSGKTSLLGACLIEIMRKYRILTIEDVLELPTEYLRKLGYNLQALKVRSALTKGGAELSAEEGIRTSLRMGDSAIIVGEIRSTEALSLYEAMRIGAGANVVAGTIHGDSTYGVFDRVVNDLGVPRTSFKATDIVIMTNPIWTAGGLRKERRALSITEIRKHWEQDPVAEGGFVDLLKYNAKTDELEPTSDLINGESEVIKSIGANVKEWVGNWDAIWENILLRAKTKEALVKYANSAKKPELLEADFVVKANDCFHKITDRIRDESGGIDCKRIFELWEEWLKSEIKSS
ncbi:type II/IV secretion system ATPase subunit [archaeon]|nr:type II/IV secretion system ATPase subunit [archaeon]